MKHVIAIDFDDVLAAFNQAYVHHHNQYYKSPRITYQDIVTFDMTVLYGVDQQTVVERVRKFCHEHHDEIWPVAGVNSALEKLSMHSELHIVTSRCESLRAITGKLLQAHDLDGFFSGIHFTNGFGSLYPDRKRTKLEVCREIDAAVLIEDAPSNAQEVCGEITVLMPDRPWNQGFVHTNCIRFGEWSEVPALFEPAP